MAKKAKTVFEQNAQIHNLGSMERIRALYRLSIDIKDEKLVKLMKSSCHNGQKIRYRPPARPYRAIDIYEYMSTVGASAQNNEPFYIYASFPLIVACLLYTSPSPRD